MTEATENSGGEEPAPESVMLTPKELAADLGRTVDELQKWRRQGKGPKWVRVSRRNIRYLRVDVDEWQESNG